MDAKPGTATAISERYKYPYIKLNVLSRKFQYSQIAYSTDISVTLADNK